MLLPFDYVRAGTREDAVNLAIEAGHTGSFLAGGTDLFVRMYDRQLRPKTLIDLKAIEGIEGIEHQNGEGPVSYTHLDVYKRQGLFFTDSFLCLMTLFPPSGTAEFRLNTTMQLTVWLR